MFGSSTSYPHLQTLAETGQIVLVSLNYRLAAFGFLAHPALSAADPRGVSGNYGILDQQQALQWVQRNIGAFGGDVGRVTVLGQSSGGETTHTLAIHGCTDVMDAGTSIFALLSSPGSRGLFQGAISLSGSPNITIDLQSIEAQFAPLVAKYCDQATPAEVLACLSALPAAKVAAIIPFSYNGAPSLPVSPAGQFYPGAIAMGAVTCGCDLNARVACR